MQYPKMLYKGNITKYQHAIAQDAEHEDALIDQGFVEFDRLETHDHDSGSVGESTPKKQISSGALELAEVKHERDQLKKEVERLNAVIERGSAENIALQKRIDELSAPAEEPAKPKATPTRTKAE